MMIYTLVWAHFVCDFVLQSDTMAKRKSSSNAWLGKHIAAYTLSLVAVLAFWHSLQGSLLYGLVNGLAHFATDYVTSRITSRLWKQGQVHNFFVVIGFDQAVHLTTLIATLPLLRL